jgi:RNA polymerase sigma-70 factor (ECF subfamily)
MPAAATTPPLDDALLMQRYASGSEDAFAVLYDRHAASTWRFVMRSVRNTAVADDLTQNIWFAVARSAPTYTYRAKFRTWLFTIAHNAVVDHFRSEKSIIQDAPTSENSEEPVDGASELAAIEQLPMEQRQAFLLQVEAGMDLAEIAKATGVSFETVKSRLRYARSKLRDLLLDFA